MEINDIINRIHMHNYFYYAILFIGPLIPSFFLFKFLPSEAFGQGPLKGLKINVSGAFAGYLIIFLVAYPLLNSSIINSEEFTAAIQDELKNYNANNQIWTIKGTVLDERHKKPISFMKNPRLSTIPSQNKIEGGKFKFKMVPEWKDGVLIFDNIKIEADGFNDQTIQEDLDCGLNDFNNKKCWEISLSQKTAFFRDTLFLEDTMSINLERQVQQLPLQ